MSTWFSDAKRSTANSTSAIEYYRVIVLLQINFIIGDPSPESRCPMDPIQQILDLYRLYGNKPYGEKVSQIQHAVQVAKLAEKNNASEDLIAAALLHDIGHLLFNVSMAEMHLNDRHEILGAQLLNRWFGTGVSEPVKLHVMAKRYLCATNQGYYATLSPASKESLELQGGAMNDPRHFAAFERNPYFDQALDLRFWDDQGKSEMDKDTDLDRYIPLLYNLFENTSKPLV